MKQLPLLATALFLLAACDTESEAPASAPYLINEAAYKESVATLSSDEFGGRGPATPGEDKTVEFIAKAFADAGLKPANNGSYEQQVPLVSIEALGAPMLSVTGGSEPLALAYRADQVIWTRREQETIAVADAELVFVGYGINAPERNWNDYEGVDMTGKIAVILVNDPGFATGDAKLFNGKAMTYYGRWDYKFDEAARQGAIGAILIHETAPAAYGWVTVDSSWTGAKFGLVREDKGASLSAFESWITTESADKLFAAASLDRRALEAAALKPGFKAVPMNLAASTEFSNKVDHVTSRNVAGIVEGSEKPDEYFVYMAHWDHLGTDPSIEGDGIYNGALDNATGTAGLIELARAFAGAREKPKRSVLFVAVTAEEQGLLGSAYYAAHPLVPLAKTVAGLNMDGINNFGRTKDVTVTGYGNSELDGLLAKAAEKQGRVIVPDAHPEHGGFYRSDHFSLSKRGVPMIYPGSGTDHVERGKAYVAAVEEAFLRDHYHAASDELTDDWVFDGAIEDLTLYYHFGRSITDTGIWPAWNEGTEFKAAREASLKGSDKAQ
ncbi:M28 family metallopeptidase [Pseudokordiimonas caeni]|uniref:M28 family metallopeptidase n=1 Tax=Pseudokordiimonas caeni TaxID=2997908 RepID=UPI002810EC48|nr:M28 family metallopeptidase [Pseudokordiimonas caeni]